MVLQKAVIIDCRNHLLGRLASIVAKELLNGQRIIAVRTEEINISGSLFRNKLKYFAFLRKRTNTNPKKGPIHYRAPSRILWRVIRGMIPHKTDRGVAALERLKAYEGVPHPFDKLKRQVVPGALRVLRLKPNRKYCRLGDLASHVGWKHGALISTLETKRKVRDAAYYKTKKVLINLKAKATQNVQKTIAPLAKPLEALGY
jgi:large subunit ribosomal protein L13Ae